MDDIHAAQALTPPGWAAGVRLEISGGRIVALETGVAPKPGDDRHAILLPGMPNVHSHAFQRGMAGLAEMRGSSADSFWSWRDVMYRFALAMTPEQVEAVAAQAYAEMLEAGFTRVGEFHYLHHAADGRPYADIAEMAARIAAAANATGIGLSLLPVFYAHGGFGGAPPTDGQRRFINTIDGFAQLVEASRRAVSGLSAAVVGVAPHSLRAVTQGELAAVAAMAGSGPIHMHIAEQVKEVEDCVAWSGQLPVEWLMDHADVNARWCLIHATHMTGNEIARLARSEAVAGLCPITEANLGDGIFNAPEFSGQGGRWGIGTDSNVQIGVARELLQLEYSQRLRLRARNVLAAPGGSNGRALFDAAIAGGGRALGVAASGIVLGAAADFVSLDASQLSLASRTGDQWLDAWVFSATCELVDCVWVAGRKRVSGGRHVDAEAIGARFRAAMQQLRGIQAP